MNELRKISLFGLGLGAIIIAATAFLASQVGAQTTPSPTKSGSSLEQRIKQRKAERKIKLDLDNTERIQGTCVNTQTIIRQLRDQYVEVAKNRSDVYRRADAKLWVTIGSLKFIDKDTFKLEQQRLSFVKQVNAFEASVNEFRQSLDDMTAMNCKADANGFMSLLETARLYNTRIRTQSDGIKNDVINLIRPTLTNHANELKPNQSTQ